MDGVILQIYRTQYKLAVEEMCERGTTEWSLAADRRICHTCRILRPLRSKVCQCAASQAASQPSTLLQDLSGPPPLQLAAAVR